GHAYHVTKDGIEVSAGPIAFEARFERQSAYSLKGDPSKMVFLKVIDDRPIEQTDKQDSKVVIVMVSKVIFRRQINDFQIHRQAKRSGRVPTLLTVAYRSRDLFQNSRTSFWNAVYYLLVRFFQIVENLSSSSATISPSLTCLPFDLVPFPRR